MFLSGLARTVCVVLVVAVCVESRSHPPLEKFIRQDSTPEQQAKFRADAIAADSRAFQLYEDDDWHRYETHKEVKVSYKKSPEYSGNIYRIDLTVDAPLETVTSTLITLNERTAWDPDVKDYVIEELDQDTTILHATYIPSGFVAKLASPRDFCRLEYIKKHSDDLSSMTYTQADHPGCQKLKGFVRGIIYTSGTYCKRNEEDISKTSIVFIFQSDPKVFLPHRLLRMTACRHGFEMADDMIKAIQERTA